MLCVFQKHRKVRVPGKGEAEWGKQEEERVVISEKVAGARPQSILQGTVNGVWTLSCSGKSASVRKLYAGG